MHDRIINKDVAIKISKSTDTFIAAAKGEIDILKTLRNEAERFHVVELFSHFTYRNHEFLVFEMFSINLYEVLKSTQFSGVSFRTIREYASQLLKALLFLRQPHIGIVHCDLKPENILLRHPMRNEIKLVDFGSACRIKLCVGGSYIQSRFYRSPEIMLGLPYGFAIDMWSLGCILVEMHTGRPLFTSTDTLDQMRSIVEVMGMVPTELIRRCDPIHFDQLFEMDHDGKMSLKPNQRGKVFPSSDPMIAVLRIMGSHISRKKKLFPVDEPGQSSCCYDMFVDIVFRMLCYHPEQRLTPEEAFRHPYFQYDF